MCAPALKRSHNFESELNISSIAKYCVWVLGFRIKRASLSLNTINAIHKKMIFLIYLTEQIKVTTHNIEYSSSSSRFGQVFGHFIQEVCIHHTS